MKRLNSEQINIEAQKLCHKLICVIGLRNTAKVTYRLRQLVKEEQSKRKVKK